MCFINTTSLGWFFFIFIYHLQPTFQRSSTNRRSITCSSMSINAIRNSHPSMTLFLVPVPWGWISLMQFAPISSSMGIKFNHSYSEVIYTKFRKYHGSCAITTESQFAIIWRPVVSLHLFLSFFFQNDLNESENSLMASASRVSMPSNQGLINSYFSWLKSIIM